MRHTYNLDAVSPRMTNKKSSQTICGEAEESKSLLFSFHALREDRSAARVCLTQTNTIYKKGNPEKSVLVQLH